MSKRKITKNIGKLLNRRLFIALLILAQIAFIALMLIRSFRLRWLEDLLMLFSVLTALHLLTRHDQGAFKLSLVFLILLLPVFGGAFYWIFHFQTDNVGYRRRLNRIEQSSASAYAGDEGTHEEALLALPRSEKQLQYMKRNTPFPVYRNTDVTYFPKGEEMLERMLADFAAAERYIFLEYFIVEEGYMWDAILAVLRERAQAGVDVRLIYDDLGCFATLPPNYRGILEKSGVKCEVFNRFRPFLTSTQNNRDHRKIAVVDGRIAYTGGINLADEYVDRRVKYGKWKDNATRLCGDGAWSFTVMFLQMWSFLTRGEEQYDAYRPTAPSVPHASGWVQPYSDSPMDHENVGEHVYLHAIERARHYLYITTPYLMVDDNIITALCLAAKSGVDVRIITPQIPDKRTVHFTTRSYYPTLLRAGVRIYEYTGGFVHAKTFVTDDEFATVGTFNLDFRSLYLHFECGVCLYDSPAIADIKRDLTETFALSKEITLSDCKRGAWTRIQQNICRLFAPLM